MLHKLRRHKIYQERRKANRQISLKQHRNVITSNPERLYGFHMILLSASESASFSLRDKTAHTMDVSFSTLNKGRHYINVSAIVTIDGRVTRRNYAVGVQVIAAF